MNGDWVTGSTMFIDETDEFHSSINRGSVSIWSGQAQEGESGGAVNSGVGRYIQKRYNGANAGTMKHYEFVIVRH